MSKRKVGSAKRLGARYGRNMREKLGLVEADYKRRHKCPYCSFLKLRRESIGIWACSKCGVRFAARAYKPITRRLKTEEQKDLVEKAPVEVEEESQEEE